MKTKFSSRRPSRSSRRSEQFQTGAKLDEFPLPAMSGSPDVLPRRSVSRCGKTRCRQSRHRREKRPSGARRPARHQNLTLRCDQEWSAAGSARRPSLIARANLTQIPRARRRPSHCSSLSRASTHGCGKFCTTFARFGRLWVRCSTKKKQI